MDRNDRQAIESLFERLINAERQLPQRDAEAEDYIREQISRHPGAPYYMAQTIVVQQQALKAAEERIEELEAEIDSSQPASDVPFSRISKRQAPRSLGSVPRVARSSLGAEQQASPQNQGGGFLAGAAQTAMGVAGGFLLGNLITDMMVDKKAEASESQSDSERAEDSNVENVGDDGGGFGDFDI